MPDTGTSSKSSFGFLTRKIGPVPVWLIGVAVLGGVYWYEKYGPGASASSATSTAANATGSEGAPVYVDNISGPTANGSWHYEAPQDLHATPGRTDVKLDWKSPPHQDANPEPMSYEVQVEGGTKKTVPAVSAGAGSHTTTVTGLKAGTSYSATVKALGGGGGGDNPPASVSFQTTGAKAQTSQDAKGHTAAEKASDEPKTDTSGTTPTGSQSSGRWRTPYTPAAPTAATPSAPARGAPVKAPAKAPAKAPVKTTGPARKPVSKSKAATKRPARSGAK